MQTQLLLDTTQDVPYFLLIDLLESYIEYQKQIKFDQTLHSKERLEELQNQLSSKNFQILKLENQIHELLEKPQKEQLKIKELQTQIDEQHKVIIQLNQRVEDQQLKIREIDQLDQLEQKIGQQEKDLKLKSLQIDNLNKIISEMEDENSYQKKISQQIQELYQNAIIKLTQNANYVQEMKIKIEKLEEENKSLFIRAAASFDDMTPRPD